MTCLGLDARISRAPGCPGTFHQTLKIADYLPNGPKRTKTGMGRHRDPREHALYVACRAPRLNEHS
jgi:hypothetical protein